MSIEVQDYSLYLHNLHTRLPFHYGIAVLTSLPHLFVRAICRIDGKVQEGVAADSLVPKWFTKNPEKTYRQEIREMIAVIESAGLFAREAREQETVYDLWKTVWAHQNCWAAKQGFPPLLGNFGVSLVERAVIDAYCRARGTSFSEALRSNAFGIRLDELHPELGGYVPGELLPAEPLSRLTVRHTIGLSDWLTEDEIQPGERAADGLPESLEASIDEYGLTHFKIKISGEASADIERLKRVAAVLERSVPSGYAYTLDGNEQFSTVSQFRSFWDLVQGEAELASFREKLLFVEQPVRRDLALTARTKAELNAWEERPAIIIDESDSQIDSLETALDCGYAGTSHKNCKGVIKGIANACLLAHRCAADPEGCFILSGEDLVNIGPVALLQDLAVMANLGIDHVERNGHHYFTGMSSFDQEIQDHLSECHADLYSKSGTGYPTLQIEAGQIRLESVIRAPFGLDMDLDLSCCFTPEKAWRYELLAPQ